MLSRSLGHRAPLLWLVLPFIAGLVAGRMLGIERPLGLLVAATVAGVSACVSAWRGTRLWAPSLVLTLGLAGAASYVQQRNRLPPWETLPPREAVLTLRVDRIFARSNAHRASGLALVLQADAHLRDLVGQRIYFSVSLHEGQGPLVRSAQVKALGVLATVPLRPPATSFDGFLAGAGVNFRLARGRMLTEERPASAYYKTCARIAGRFHALLGHGIAEKQPALTGLLRAMMLGATHELSDEQHALFMQSGTMHLFAISGLNIGVIAAALQALLILLRLPEWLRFVLGAALLWLFVDVTGTSASAVRAFAMAVFLQAAWLLRQPHSVLAALVLSAFVVLLHSPLQVFSASFLMSYTIVAALLALGLPLADAWLARWTLWRDLPKVTWRLWRHALDLAWRTTLSAVAVGVATLLVSLLTGVEFFQILTPGSLFANLILIPAAIVVTLGGFASLVCGLVGFLPGAAWCNHAAALTLAVIEWLVRVSVQWPGAFLPARFSAEWIGPTALAILLATLLGGYATGWRLSRGGWWPPFAVVALVLLFGVTFGA